MTGSAAGARSAGRGAWSAYIRDEVMPTLEGMSGHIGISVMVDREVGPVHHDHGLVRRSQHARERREGARPA